MLAIFSKIIKGAAVAAIASHGPSGADALMIKRSQVPESPKKTLAAPNPYRSPVVNDNGAGYGTPEHVAEKNLVSQFSGVKNDHKQNKDVAMFSAESQSGSKMIGPDDDSKGLATGGFHVTEDQIQKLEGSELEVEHASEEKLIGNDNASDGKKSFPSEAATPRPSHLQSLKKKKLQKSGRDAATKKSMFKSSRANREALVEDLATMMGGEALNLGAKPTSIQRALGDIKIDLSKGLSK